MNFHLLRWALGSACCGHEAVISVTSLLNLRLTVEAVKFFAELPKDLMAEGKQIMVFCVTETMASWPPWADPTAHLRRRKFRPCLWGKGWYTELRRIASGASLFTWDLMLYYIFLLAEELCHGCWKLSFLLVIQGQGVPELTQRSHEDQYWKYKWAMGFTTLEGHKEICSPAAFVVSLQILEGFKVWRSPTTVCATEQKLPFLCTWLWIFIYSVLSLKILPNYYFSFPFKISPSRYGL